MGTKKSTGSKAPQERVWPEALVTKLEGLVQGNSGRSVLALLKRAGETVRVAESEVMMGQYAAVVLNGDGFACESGRGGESAAHAGNNPKLTPIFTLERVRELIWQYDETLPSEEELVKILVAKIKEIRDKNSEKKRRQ